jgi:putative aldouronate transport system permease protein
MKQRVSPIHAVEPRDKNGLIRYLRYNFWLYVLLIPGMVFLLIFRYIPMGGIVIAFKDYNVVKGIMDSPWVGMKHFAYLFESDHFLRVFRNSLLISSYRLLWGFPVPIFLALLLNEMRSQWYKRSLQTVLYLPHFISWVVVIGMVNNLLSPSTGILNYIINAAGGKSIYFLTTPAYFRSVLVASDIWKGAGWGTIVYMAAIAGIDPSLYEAAIIDGASRLQRIRFVTLPSIMSTIIVMLILRTGSIMSNGFEQVYLLQNALVNEVAEVFETYTYQVGLREGRFSFASAVGIFQSIIGCILLYTNNFFARRYGGRGLW